MSKVDDLRNAIAFHRFVYGYGEDLDMEWARSPGAAKSVARGMARVNRALVRALRAARPRKRRGDVS